MPGEGQPFWNVDDIRAGMKGVGKTVISLDHNPAVSKHWNSKGNSTNQADRKEFYSRIEILDPMCLECNRHIGGEDYTPEVTESFTGPHNKR
jgi:hypothetical protein